MSSSARTSDLTLLTAGGAAMLVLTALTFLVSPPSTAPQDTGSSYSPGPDGAKAAFLLLQELGYEVERSFDPLATLRADPSRTLIVLTDPTVQSSQQDRLALLRFVDAGGVVLATGLSSAAFLPGLTTSGAHRGPSADRSYLPAFPSDLARRVSSIRMDRPAREVRADPAWIPVFASNGEAGVLTARRPSGRLIWWASSRPLTNSAADDTDNLDLLLNALGAPRSRRILWDEYYHGHARTLWSYASGTPVAWGLGQLGLIAAAVLFTFGRYVAPPQSRMVTPRTSPLEFIDMMGGLYERARTTAAAVGVARSHVRRQLVTWAGVAASSTDERLVSVLVERFGVDGPAARSVLERAERMARDPHVREADALALVQQLQHLVSRPRDSQHNSRAGHPG
jgi:hypothetical protein